jgi:hypothetical protein
MGCEVYANGNAIACKAADGKTTAAMPDVCLSPPSPPAGPVPIPYPNTGMASDTTDGSQTVQIGGQEVMLKNKSVFKQSSGDEAATKSLGMGVVTHQIQGKVNFINWSMDVKFEGENVPRHLDMTGHNEASDPPNCPPWPYMDSMVPPDPNACNDEKQAEDDACKSLTVRRDTKKGPGTGAILKGQTQAKICEDNEQAEKCREAQKCKLTPQKEGCCPNSGQEAHHIVEAHGFCQAGTRNNLGATPLTQFSQPQPGYQPGEAPCVCAQGQRWEAEHGAFHGIVGKRENTAVLAAAMTGGDPTSAWTYGSAKQAGVQAHQKIFPDSKCSEKCLKAQLDAYHNQFGISDNTSIRTETAALQPWQQASDDNILSAMNDHLAAGGSGGVS